MGLLSLAASPIVSSLMGGIFPLANGILQLYQKRDDRKHEQEMKRIDLEILIRQADIKQAEIAGTLATEREKGNAQAFVASQEVEAKIRGEHRAVTSFRAITRPALTWFYQMVLLGIVIAIMCGVALDQVENPILQYIIISAVNTATMTVSWWFGQRQMDKTLEWGNRTTGARLATSK